MDFLSKTGKVIIAVENMRTKSEINFSFLGIECVQEKILQSNNVKLEIMI
jgi:hypothetical protein